MENIFFILERMRRMTGIPISYFDLTGKICLFCTGYEPKIHPLVRDLGLRKSIINKMSSDLPILEFEGHILYGACKDELGCSIILGPVCIDQKNRERDSDYAKMHKMMSAEGFEINQKELDAVSSTLVSICFMTAGKTFTEKEIASRAASRLCYEESKKDAVQSFTVESIEQEFARFNFTEEMSFVEHIRDGNPAKVEEILDGKVPAEDILNVKTLKQNEYLACLAIYFASRAAAKGGLDIDAVNLSSDLQLARLEECNSIEEIAALLREVLLDYATQVKELNKSGKSRDTYVLQCIKYIEGHLNKAFTVDDVANAVGLNKAYLSRRFTEAIGMGMMRYTQRRRIETAAVMLQTTAESVAKISSYLCFTSQSHFGKVFKFQMHMAPRQYRDKHKNMLMD
ncbi:MAG: AraC family transcriptional regulator [Clostridiales bacterium]|jgi:AraC-like DNA-binding protein|nr:AraC family transcriptional regulator [Clostridiales bacterium]